MHSHVLPIPPCTWTAVSHTVRAARAQYAFATRPAASASDGCEVVDRPRRVQRDAERAFHQAARVGEQVLHRLERTDRDAVLLPLRRVRDRDVEHAAHHADEVGAREREAERGPRGEIVVGEQPSLLGDRCTAGTPGETRCTMRGQIGAVIGTARFRFDRHDREAVTLGPRARGRTRHRPVRRHRRPRTARSSAPNPRRRPRRADRARTRRPGLRATRRRPAARDLLRAPDPRTRRRPLLRRARRRRSRPRHRSRAARPSPRRRAARASPRHAPRRPGAWPGSVSSRSATVTGPSSRAS